MNLEQIKTQIVAAVAQYGGKILLAIIIFWI